LKTGEKLLKYLPGEQEFSNNGLFDLTNKGVTYSEGSKGLFSLISKRQGFLFHWSGRDMVRIKSDRTEVPSVLGS